MKHRNKLWVSKDFLLDKDIVIFKLIMAHLIEYFFFFWEIEDPFLVDTKLNCKFNYVIELFM